ncbi:MAG: hypothetical protein M4579_003470 [Chaenotheca gracillima]|nr:MAG: hypothetical protein M4579_003470 [Chaenotheca gracillima]
MPYFPPDMQPQIPAATQELALRPSSQQEEDHQASIEAEKQSQIRVKNRRKFYLDHHPEYFSGLELVDPLLYDRCIRRFQSAAEREAEGKRKGYSGVLEADLFRGEAKLAAALSGRPPAYIPTDPPGTAAPSLSGSGKVGNGETEQPLSRPQQGEINSTYLLPGEEEEDEEAGDTPEDKAAGVTRWQQTMTRRFLAGEDDDFNYAEVDESEAFDDRIVEEREAEEKWFDKEEPEWVGIDTEKPKVEGETGVQDF